MNRVTKGLKETLCNTVKDDKKESKSEKPAQNNKKASKKTAKDDEERKEETSQKKNWRTTTGSFTCNGAKAEFGAGNLSLSVGTLNPGHLVCISTICG